MAILKGFPPSNSISPGPRITVPCEFCQTVGHHKVISFGYYGCKECLNLIEAMKEKDVDRETKW